MFAWINIPKAPEATWSEISTLYLDNFLKDVTYSDVDRAHNPVVLRNVPSIPIGGKGFGIDFTPLSFLSCFHVDSRKGNV